MKSNGRDLVRDLQRSCKPLPGHPHGRQDRPLTSKACLKCPGPITVFAVRSRGIDHGVVEIRQRQTPWFGLLPVYDAETAIRSQQDVRHREIPVGGDEWE